MTPSTTIQITIPLGGARPSVFAEAIRAAYLELQAHAEACEDEEHLADTDDALSLLSELCDAFQTAKVCTSDDPTSHQGDTCPIHEEERV